VVRTSLIVIWNVGNVVALASTGWLGNWVKVSALAAIERSERHIQARFEPDSAGRGCVSKRLAWRREARLGHGVVLGVELECHRVTNGSADICRAISKLTVDTDNDFMIGGLGSWTGGCNPEININEMVHRIFKEITDGVCRRNCYML
jgi:hypothetical protein